MKQNGLIFLFAFIFLGSIYITAGSGCANIIPPTGGPRDSLPPLLISATPRDSARNFTGKRITLVFNEFVDLDNPLENVLVSPTPKLNPQVERKLRTVTVQLKDTLEPNTTYTINFGNAIKDINEGNILKNFTYSFSTGAYIDSLMFAGKVVMAETGLTDSTMIVVLHTNLTDSAVIKERPRYIAKLDGEGNFLFRNLPADTFAVYALKDEGGQRRYLSKTQAFAFADAPVKIDTAVTPITLFAYVEKPETPEETPAAKPPPGRPTTTVADKRLRLETNLVNGELDLLSNLEISFKSAPLKFFDSSKVQFYTDSFTLISNPRFIKDTSNKKITLIHNWTENKQYHLIVDKDFAEDTAGRKLLKNDTLSFRTKKQSEYGLVRLRLLNLDLTKNPVLQFVQGNNVVFSHVFKGNREFNARLFTPGEYELRILYDENKNGVWDPGEFFKTRKQPEKILRVSRRLNVKANWDNEVDITL